MTYFKVDDKLHDHRKSRRARRAEDGTRSAAAIGLWVQAGSWSMANGTDGFVPTDELDRWDNDGQALAQRLVDAELWHPATKDGEDGYLFHEWDEWQHSVDYLNERRRRNRDRMRTKRANDPEQSEAVHAHSEDTARTVGSTTTPTTTTTKDSDHAEGRATAAAVAAVAEFDRFWQLYPRKVGKAAAAKAWAKAVKSTEVATIAAGLRNAIAVWTATGTEARFIPHPSTWLNEGRWDDEQPTLPHMPATADPAAAVQRTYDLPALGEPPEHVTAAGGRAVQQWMREQRAAQQAELAQAGGL